MLLYVKLAHDNRVYPIYQEKIPLCKLIIVLTSHAQHGTLLYYKAAYWRSAIQLEATMRHPESILHMPEYKEQTLLNKKEKKRFKNLLPLIETFT